MANYIYERLGGGIVAAVTPQHTFGTDSFLLSYFAAPKNKDKVTDLGSGCGIIPLLWYRNQSTTPKESWGLDIQPLAVEQMKAAVDISGIAGFNPLLGDLNNIRTLLPSGSMDIVTCNPPYKAEGTGLLSGSASDKIARHETMCTIDDVCKASAWLLRFGGRLCICQLTERLADVIVAMRANGIEPKRMQFVHSTSKSAPYLVLVEGKRGAKPFLTVEPPLFIRENGKFTKEMLAIYGEYSND